MIVKSAELVAVGVQPKQYPLEDLPEIAIAGRSNVGKSSLINMIMNRKKLARTSSSPGKTQTVNFYEINNEFRIVDLPGYGYARVSKTQREKWGEMIELFLRTRSNLLNVIQLIDLRHPPSKQDIQMYEWLKYFGLDGIVVGTKADKISKNELQKNISVIRKALNMEKDDIFLVTSSSKRQGADDVRALIFDLAESGAEAIAKAMADSIVESKEAFEEE